MNITFLSRLFYPHKGGVERHVFELSKCLIQQDHSITIVTEQFDDNIPLEETWNDIRIIRIPFENLQSKRSLWSWMLKHTPIFTDADIIHIHDVYWWYWPLRFKLLNTPTYITFHGYEGSNPPSWKAVVQRKAAEKVCAGSICIGDFMRMWYHANPTLVSYGAADMYANRLTGLPLLKKIIPMMTTMLTGSGAAAQSTVNPAEAVFWGRFDYDTGYDVYVEAAAKMPHLSLQVYGDGPLAGNIPLPPNVRQFPWKENVSELIGAARYAFVSRYLSILEAMQAKRLVCAVYNNAIKRDYILCHPMRDNMITAGSAAELVYKLTHLSSQDERRMVTSAYEWAKAQTWEQLTTQYLNLWHR